MQVTATLKIYNILNISRFFFCITYHNSCISVQLKRVNHNRQQTTFLQNPRNRKLKPSSCLKRTCFSSLGARLSMSPAHARRPSPAIVGDDPWNSRDKTSVLGLGRFPAPAPSCRGLRSSLGYCHDSLMDWVFGYKLQVPIVLGGILVLYRIWRVYEGDMSWNFINNNYAC